MRTDTAAAASSTSWRADQLILKPRLYSSFLLWLLSELFENLPEVGDLDRPKLVFFFDEAHLLFDDAPPALRQRVEQVVRIIRSKGVGVYFCSQFPDDVPNEILGQLGNRIQHALRAYTPRDQKAVRTAAETFVANPKLDVGKVIAELGVGEALVSMLQDKGVPMPVERTLVCPPRCRMGAITPEERATVRSRSPISGKYDARVNRESAYEILSQRTVSTDAPAARPSDAPSRSQAPAPERAPRQEPTPAQDKPGLGTQVSDILWGTKRRQGMVEAMAKQAARTVGSPDRPPDSPRRPWRNSGRIAEIVRALLWLGLAMFPAVSFAAVDTVAVLIFQEEGRPLPQALENQEKVGQLAVEMLASATYEAGPAVAEQRWLEVRRWPHLYVAFTPPRSVRFQFSTTGPAVEQEVQVAEIIMRIVGEWPDYILVRERDTEKGLLKVRPARGAGAAGCAANRSDDTMKITVCERPDETARRETARADLVCSPRANPTDAVVLPEMPFCEWQTFRTRQVDFSRPPGRPTRAAWIPS